MQFEPLAKHWIYSKVFHDEFEGKVAAALENCGEETTPCVSNEEPSVQELVPEEQTSFTVCEEPGDVYQPEEGEVEVVQEYQGTSQQLLASDQVQLAFNTTHPQFVQQPPVGHPVILPANVQGLGDVNLLVQADGQARILPANNQVQVPGPEYHQGTPSVVHQRQFVMVPVTISMTISSCVPGIMVADASDVAGCASMSPAALGSCPSFIG
jgi:hypothetical protein